MVSPVGVDAMMTQFGQPLMRKCIVAGIYDSNNKDYDAHYAFISLESRATALPASRTRTAGSRCGCIRSRMPTQVKADLRTRLGPTLQRLDLVRSAPRSLLRHEDRAVDGIHHPLSDRRRRDVQRPRLADDGGDRETARHRGPEGARRDAERASRASSCSKESWWEPSAPSPGVLIGLLVCYLQITYRLFPLDPTVYIIPAIPVEMRWTDFVAVVRRFDDPEHARVAVSGAPGGTAASGGGHSMGVNR